MNFVLEKFAVFTYRDSELESEDMAAFSLLEGFWRETLRMDNILEDIFAAAEDPEPEAPPTEGESIRIPEKRSTRKS